MANKRLVSPERSYWRDVELSIRHRMYGYDTPCTDIDHLLIEYSDCKPVAIIEHKSEHAKPVMPGNPSILAIERLADAAKLPFFVVRYSGDFRWWWVMSVNAIAKRILPKREKMTEIEYVEFLYRLRGKPMPKEVRNSLLPF
ncbi:MAG: hypothetical protein HPY45_07840 [Anaerolineae bacterium]|nr:hypothetical protein [Anaerolineae bacterium]